MTLRKTVLVSIIAGFTISGVGSLLLAVVLVKPYREINPQWADNATVIRIGDSSSWGLIGQPWYYEFSSDSRYFAVWDYENKSPYDFSNFPYIGVWDLKGNQVADAIDSTQLFMAPRYRSLFDKCALREAPYWDFTNGHYSKFTPYPNIAKYAMGWFVSPDWKYMVTFTNPLFEKWLKELETNSGVFKPDFNTVTMEMWQLEPVTNKIWENTYTGFTNPNMGRFYSPNDSLNLLLVVSFQDVHIYSWSDGKLLHSFSLYIETTEEELQNRIERFHLEQWSSLHDAEFTPFQMAFAPEKELIACQDDNSKRFRVFSTKPNSGLIYKGNENESPKSQSSWLYASGPWLYDGIRFGGGGKYLLVSYQLGTRAMFRPIPQQLVTEIYDTDTWKLIWQKNTEHIRNICVSNDGQKVALMRDNIFEIGDIESFLKGCNK